MDETTLPATELPDAIREGCACVLTRRIDKPVGWHEAGRRVTVTGVHDDRLVVDTDIGPVPLDALAIDLDPGRATGQWAVAMWWRAVPKWPTSIVPLRRIHVFSMMGSALRSEADPAELRRVVLELRGA